VALHFGTLIALLVYFRKDWITLIKELPDKNSLVWHIFFATIPAAAAGFIFHDTIEHLRNPLLIVFTLSLVALFMIVVERWGKESFRLGIDRISRKYAMIIGVAQALALIPGVSRSGITILAGLMLGVRRQDSARFSFLLSTPIILGASMLEARTMILSSNIEVDIFLAGMFFSSVSGYFAIKYLLRFFQSHTLKPFAYYRFFLAFVIILAMLV
jgi:undecaprenyl-diphosphatase